MKRHGEKNQQQEYKRVHQDSLERTDGHGKSDAENPR